jgi:heat shock protein HslJ
MTHLHVLVLVLASLLGVAGCGGATPAPSTTEPASGRVDDATLGARHWQLVEATGADGARLADLFPDPARPIQLDFAEGRVSVSNACNRMSGSYRLEGERLSVGDVMQTEMACEEARMRAEAAIGRVLRAGGTLRLEGDVLVWTTPTSETLRLRGEPTAEARYGGPGERVFLEVAAQRVTCSHPEMPDHTCLSVREIRYDDSGIVTSRGEWEVLYQEIEGFTHQPGVRTVLRLTRHRIANPPADGSSIAYVLDMVVESELVGQ